MIFIGKKLLRFLFIILAVTSITFLMVNILPGDVAYMVGGESATLEDIQTIRENLGLNRNIVVRYFTWLGQIFHGNLGKSYMTRESVFDIILSRLPVTIELIAISQLLTLALAVPAGLLSAYRSGSYIDRMISTTGFATISMPSFVMSLMTIYLFSIQLQWLPATGYTPLSVNPWANIKSFLLPSLSIALIEWVVLMRVLRSDMISTLQTNFILMAKAKGLPPWKILLKHAFRPSSFTLITVLGIQIGRLLGEAVIVETIFALPGMGRLLINAIYARDYLIVQGCILLITVGYVAINSIVDLAYIFLDPRIREEARHVG